MPPSVCPSCLGADGAFFTARKGGRRGSVGVLERCVVLEPMKCAWQTGVSKTSSGRSAFQALW